MNLEKKKYEFTGETMEFEGHTLYRIRYLRDIFLRITKGQVGGWIEGKHNLSHQGECCVDHDAKVYGYARVMDDAYIFNNATVKDNVQIKERASIYHRAIVGADTIVAGKARIGGNSKIYFYADELYGQPNILGESQITGITLIEATGTISNSQIRNQELSGFLEIENQNL